MTMAVRDDVLQMIADGDAHPVSGESIAQSLGVSRAAVWKAVKRLQDDGYDISGTQNFGYVLDGAYDPMTEQGIIDALPCDVRELVHVTFKQTTGSTNIDAMELAKAGAPEFSVVVAATQDGGKGRRGRSFFSPKGTGVYLSMLFKPDLTMMQSSFITCSAAVAVCRALEHVCGVQPSIKWVNDVFVHGRKVCGILTEGAADLETGSFSYAVTGIGINVYEPEGGFPESIAGKAGAVMKAVQRNTRNKLAAEVISQLIRFEHVRMFVSCVEEYKRYSMMQDARIDVSSADGSIRRGTSIQVNDDLTLRVAWDDGGFSDLRSEEVSIILREGEK